MKFTIATGKGAGKMGNMNMLRAKIKETGLTVTAVANKSGILRETLYNRMRGESEFRASEIRDLSAILRLTRKEQDDIFFA